MLTLAFMRHAFIASTFIAVVSGIVGVFVVARQLSFLTHTLSEIGFAGASFAVFAGWPALDGMILFTMLSSVLVGQMSIKESRREAVISAVSALFIGLGILFLSLSSQTASSATSILFGSVVGISANEVHQLIVLSAVVLLITLAVYRQLKFSSFDPIGARVTGVNETLISVIFLLLLALSVSAKYFTHGVCKMIVLAILFSLLGTWLGLLLGYLTNWPVSFFIAVIEVIIYVVALVYQNYFVEAN